MNFLHTAGVEALSQRRADPSPSVTVDIVVEEAADTRPADEALAQLHWAVGELCRGRDVLLAGTECDAAFWRPHHARNVIRANLAAESSLLEPGENLSHTAQVDIVLIVSPHGSSVLPDGVVTALRAMLRVDGIVAVLSQDEALGGHVYRELQQHFPCVEQLVQRTVIGYVLTAASQADSGMGEAWRVRHGAYATDTASCLAHLTIGSHTQISLPAPAAWLTTAQSEARLTTRLQTEQAHLKQALARKEAELQRERRRAAWRDSMLRAELREAQAELREDIARLEAALHHERALQKAAEARLTAAPGEHFASDVSALGAQPAAYPQQPATSEVPALWLQAEALRNSTSWRLTAPLRSVGRLLRGRPPADPPLPPGATHDALCHWISAVQNSTSWRLTAPLRELTTFARGQQLPFLNGGSHSQARAQTPQAPLSGVLVVADTIPLYDRNSGGLRQHTLLEMLVELGHCVTYASFETREFHDNHLLSASERQRYEESLARIGVKRVLYGVDEVRTAMAAGTEGLATVIASFPHVASSIIPLARRHAPGARVLYDMVDFHALRMEREARLHDDKSLLKEAQRMRKRELSLIRKADTTLAITEDERRAVLEAAPKASIEVLPNVFRIPSDVPAGPEGRDGLLFVGGFWHKPNADAVLWFAREVWPLVQAAAPDVTLRIAGNAPDSEVRALADLPGVEVLGYVEELKPLYDRSRVTIAPLRYGAGMKGKVGQSMVLGVPIVTTPVGAEGLGVRDGYDMLITQDAKEFAEATLRLLHDDALWLQLQQNARHTIAELCSFETVAQKLRAVVNG